MNRYKRRRYAAPPSDAEPVKGRSGTVYYMGYIPLLAKAENSSLLYRLRGFWLHPTKGWRHAIGERVS